MDLCPRARCRRRRPTERPRRAARARRQDRRRGYRDAQCRSLRARRRGARPTGPTPSAAQV